MTTAFQAVSPGSIPGHCIFALGGNSALFLPCRGPGMNNYDAINDEIKSFLTLADRHPKEAVEPIEDAQAECGNLSSLIALLTSLQGIYTEINTNLGAGDNEGVRKTLLNSEVKMSLVCESLMRVLKDVSQEKSELMRSEEEGRERLRRVAEEKEALEIRISRMESELEFTKRGNQELGRVIRDQKNKIQGFKEKADLEKRNCDSFRSINEELEMLRKKTLEKCGVYEKEIGVLKEYLRERAEDVKKMREGFKQMEAEKEALGKRVVGMEKGCETMRKKLEMKESTLGLCNSELSKLISKEKRMEGEFEDLREKAAYYERLYKATNGQNEYLNTQLARMINMGERMEVPEYRPNAREECPAEESRVDTKSNRSYQKRLRKYKRRAFEQSEACERSRNEVQNLGQSVERLRGENQRLQEEKERAVSTHTKITDDLMRKVEQLMEKNREYQTIIYSSKDRAARRDADVPLRSKPEADESFKTVNDGEEHPAPESLFRRREEPWKTSNLKPFVLENEYEKEPREDSYDLHGGMPRPSGVENIQSRLRMFREHEDSRPEVQPIRLNIPNGFYKSLTAEGEKEPGSSYPADPFNSTANRREAAESVASNESPKTVRTTSTLHEMLKRTDALQQKFDKLEDQLNLIKKSDRGNAEKVHDQIKAYKNYYYSDLLDMSNESDFI